MELLLDFFLARMRTPAHKDSLLTRCEFLICCPKLNEVEAKLSTSSELVFKFLCVCVCMPTELHVYFVPVISHSQHAHFPPFSHIHYILLFQSDGRVNFTSTLCTIRPYQLFSTVGHCRSIWGKCLSSSPYFLLYFQSKARQYNPLHTFTQNK